LEGKAALAAIDSEKHFTQANPVTWDDSSTYFSVPYPALLHYDPSEASESFPWAVRRTRPKLVAGVFNEVHVGKAATAAMISSKGRESPLGKLRLKVGASCRQSTRCTFVAPGNGPSRTGPGHRSTSLLLARAYWNATFCLNPVGDRFGRKGVVDALVMGCIPVLFHQQTLQQWAWHWGDWRDQATVVLDMSRVISGQLDVIDELLRIPEDRISRMQATIAANAHRMQYALHDRVQTSLPDAFVVTLRALWARSQRLQQSAAAVGGFLALSGVGGRPASFSAGDPALPLGAPAALLKANSNGSILP